MDMILWLGNETWLGNPLQIEVSGWEKKHRTKQGDLPTGLRFIGEDILEYSGVNIYIYMAHYIIHYSTPLE